MGLAATVAPKSLGAQTPEKRGFSGWTLWVNRLIENQFSKFSSLNPPSLKIYKIDHISLLFVLFVQRAER